MKTNKTAIDLICKSYTDDITTPIYKRPGDIYPTIGYGHYAPDSAGIYNKALEDHGEFTVNDARSLLKDDLVRFETIIERDCRHLKLNANQFSALVVYVYQYGRGNLLSLIKGRDKKEIGALLTDKVKKIYNKGDAKNDKSDNNG